MARKRLILASFLHDRLPEFVRGRLAYVGDAARSYGDTAFAVHERTRLHEMGFELVDLPLLQTRPESAARVLDSVDGVYVAGGETFDLLNILRSTGNFEVLKTAVECGLPYIGTSAGSVLAAPEIGYIRASR